MWQTLWRPDQTWPCAGLLLWQRAERLEVLLRSGRQHGNRQQQLMPMRRVAAAACETRSSPALSCSPDADACPARGGSAPRGTGHAHNSSRASGQRYIVRTKCCVRPRDVIISRLSVPCPRAAGVEPQACRFLVRADLAVQRSIDGQRRRRARPLLREDVRRPRAQPIGRLSHGWRV